MFFAFPQLSRWAFYAHILYAPSNKIFIFYDFPFWPLPWFISTCYKFAHTASGSITLHVIVADKKICSKCCSNKHDDNSFMMSWKTPFRDRETLTFFVACSNWSSCHDVCVLCTGEVELFATWKAHFLTNIRMTMNQNEKWRFTVVIRSLILLCTWLCLFHKT